MLYIFKSHGAKVIRNKQLVNNFELTLKQLRKNQGSAQVNKNYGNSSKLIEAWTQTQKTLTLFKSKNRTKNNQNNAMTKPSS